MKQQGKEGNVKLAILIDANGKIREIKVLKSSHPEFANAAIEAIQQSSFTPAESNGKPVASIYKIPFNFALR